MNLLKLSFFISFLLISDWIKFSPLEQEFKIEAPCKIKTQNTELLLDIGKLNIHNCSCSPETEDPNFLYVVNYVDYPDGIMDPDSISLQKEIIDESISSTILNLKGTLDYQTEIYVGDHKGYLARISYDQGKKVCKSKYLIHNNRFYALQVYSFKEQSINKNAERFFNSFGLLKH